MRRLVVLLGALMLLVSCVVSAHEGHDHAADAAVPKAETALPRLSLQSPRLELVAVRDGDDLRIFVDDFDSNAPLSGLRVQAQLGTQSLVAEEAEPGLYRVSVADAGEAPVPITFLLQGADWQERLDGTLPAPVVIDDAVKIVISGWWLLAAAVALVLLVFIAFLRRRRRRKEPG